jgi:hypothetical protein
MERDREGSGAAEAAGSKLLLRRGRVLVALGAGLLVLSVAFPVVASLLPQEAPAWMGVFDVALAAGLVLAALGADAATRGPPPPPVIQRSYQFYRLVATLPLGLLLVFFLVGGAIKWHILLPGLAWRAWLLCYILPVVLTIWERSRASRL